MFERTVKGETDVSIDLDGDVVVARSGEPIAVALLAAGEIRLARSPKLHRPRGPSCLRGDCDGCLMRVDGEPNVMTCLRAVRGGEKMSTQNVLGTRRTDLLRVTDWFFPKGIDHHHLFAGVPGVSGMMTSFARKMAGLGRLPDHLASAPGPRATRRVETDVVVVGGGRSGAATAAALATLGLRVVLVDEGDEIGGDTLLLGREGRADIAALDLSRVVVFGRATAIGVYERDLLVVARDGSLGAGADVVATTVVAARAYVFATGAHDGALAVENNDLPGIFSARAILRLAAFGVRPRERYALVGDGRFAGRVASLWPDLAVARWSPAELARIEGGSAVRAAVSSTGERVELSGIFTDLPSAPAFELAEQAGARLTHVAERGFAVDVDERGCAGDRVWAIGSCTTTPFAPEAAVRLTADVLSQISR